jgi:hypothetical protein
MKEKEKRVVRTIFMIEWETLNRSQEAEAAEGVTTELLAELPLEGVDDGGTSLEILGLPWPCTELKVPPTGAIDGVKLDATMAAADLKILKSFVWSIISGLRGNYDRINSKKHSRLTKVFVRTVKIPRLGICHIYCETSARSRPRPDTYWLVHVNLEPEKPFVKYEQGLVNGASVMSWTYEIRMGYTVEQKYPNKNELNGIAGLNRKRLRSIYSARGTLKPGCNLVMGSVGEGRTNSKGSSHEFLLAHRGPWWWGLTSNIYEEESSAG